MALNYIDNNNKYSELCSVGEIKSIITAHDASSYTAPDGWLLCDGTEYNSSDYEELAKILTGNNTPPEKFNVPNLIGKMLQQGLFFSERKKYDSADRIRREIALEDGVSISSSLPNVSGSITGLDTYIIKPDATIISARTGAFTPHGVAQPIDGKSFVWATSGPELEVRGLKFNSGSVSDANSSPTFYPHYFEYKEVIDTETSISEVVNGNKSTCRVQPEAFTITYIIKY